MSNRYLHKHKWIAVLLCLCFMMSFILPGYAMDGGVDAGGSDVSVSDGGSSGDSGSGDTGSGDATGGGESGSGDTGSGDSTGGTITPPTEGGTTTPPTEGGTTTPPTEGGTTIPPTEGGTTTPPTEGGTTTPPTEGGTTTPPTEGGTTTPPTEGGATTPPTEGGTTTPPTEGGTTTPQQPTECTCGTTTGVHSVDCPLYEDGICSVCKVAVGEHHTADCTYFPHMVGCEGEGCTMEGCACECHQPSKLYERLMACTTMAEVDAVYATAEPWELPLMTAEEKAAAESHIAAIKAQEAAQKHDVEGCTDECTGENCECKCHNKFEHIEGCDGVNCAVEGCQCPCHLLINRVLATTTMEEYYHVMGTATDEELAALTEEEQAQIDAHFMELLSLPIQAVNFTNAAPLVEATYAMFNSFISMFADEEEPVAPEDNGLELSKTATPNDDGSYTITLEAYTTGTVTTTTTTKPVDLVIMVDNSQKFLPVSLGSETVGSALKKSLTDFVDDLSAKEGSYRVSFVFAGSNVEGSADWITLDEAGKIAAKNELDKLSSGGKNAHADHAYAGIPRVETLLNASLEDPNRADANRVLVIFSAGLPHGNGPEFRWDNGNANSSLVDVKILKDAGTTVYSVGVFEGADGRPENMPPYEDNNTITANKQNRYMNLVSSNYPKANNMEGNYSLATNIPGEGYYLTAANASDLENIFESITNQIATPSIPLNEKTQIIDSIAEAFEVPENTDDVSCSTANYLTNGNWEDAQSTNYNVKIENGSVIVDGFNFDENFITEDAKTDGSYGKKLIITFTIKQKAGFLGGNNVFTNGNDSGVYNAESGFNEKFINPKVNIPIPDVMVTAEDKNVYLLDSVTSNQLQENATVKIGNEVLDFAKPNYGLESWQNQYVDFSSMVVKDASNNVITDIGLNNILLDQKYQLAFTVSPKDSEADETLPGTPAVAKTGEANGGINVYTPELSFKDSQVYYGDTVPTDFTGNLTATKWKHNGTEADTSKMGEAPELALTYTPDATKIKDSKINTKGDINVAAKVKIGETDITDKTTFIHTPCNPACSWSEAVLNGAPAFLLHPQTCQLTIKKTGGADNEPYVFDVYKDGTKYSEVTIVGNSSETIYELPVGTYSIAEKTDWSWRFTPTYSANVTLSKDATSGTITCNNTLNKHKWLNGYSNVIENIFDVAH